MTKTNRLGVVLFAAAVLFLWLGCREESPLGDEGNQPPETYLVQAPPFAQTEFYVSHLFWEGYDPDGRVEYFEVAITDSFGVLDDVTWHKTFKNDSLVRFEVGGEFNLDQVLGRRFYVRAVDNQERADPRPAWVFFGAKDIAFPEIEFVVSRGFNPDWPEPGNPAILSIGPRGTGLFPPDTLPADATAEFQWTGGDRDSLFGRPVGSISSFEHKLVAPREGDGDNDYVGQSLADTIARYERLGPGPYRFLVRALDDAGLASSPPAERYFQVNFDPWVKLARVYDSCTGDSVIAYQVSDSQFVGDPCGVGTLLGWDWRETMGNIRLAENPCLPDGYLTSGDTLDAGVASRLGWWVKVEGSFGDPDGEVASVQMNRMVCSEGNCTAVPWGCAMRDPSGGNAIYVGPLTSGDYRVIIAAVDTLGQRGIAGADTIDIQVDRAPMLVHKTEGRAVSGCDCFLGDVGEFLTLCTTDSLVRVVGTQTGSDTPCALETEYADGSNAGLSVHDMKSFPLPGQEVELEFTTSGQFPQGIASMCAILWAYDPDGHHNVGYARWNIDAAVSPITGWEVVTNSQSLVQEGSLTPICFEVGVVGEGEHVLFVEIRDWQSIDYGRRVAQRTATYRIPFTAIDIAKKRFKLPGREDS